MSTFTLAISCLTTSNLPWYMDITFQVPMQYCSLQHGTLLPSPVTSTTGCCFCFGSVFHSFWIYSSTISSHILGIYQPGEFIFNCPIFLPFHTVHGVLKARIPKWFAISFSSAPHSVRPLHHDPSILGGPTQHGLVLLSFHSFISFIHLHPKIESPIQSAKTRPGDDCGSDHELLIANLRLNLKKVGKTTRPFRYDLNQIPLMIQWKWEIDLRD